MEIMIERPKNLPSYIDVELWEPMPVKGFEERYMISNFGHVAHLNLKSRKWKLVKPTLNSRGYLCVTLSRYDRNRRTICVHKAVADAFIRKPKTDAPRLVVHHLDHNKNNNRADNLMWLTPKQHQDHHGVTEKAAEAKSQKILAKDTDGRKIVFDSIRDAMDFFMCNYEALNTALLCEPCRLTTIDGSVWEVWRIGEIRDADGNVTWKAPKPYVVTEKFREIIIKNLEGKSAV